MVGVVGTGSSSRFADRQVVLNRTSRETWEGLQCELRFGRSPILTEEGEEGTGWNIRNIRQVVCSLVLSSRGGISQILFLGRFSSMKGRRWKPTRL